MINGGTLFVLALLCLIVFGIIRGMKKDKKAGKSSCGCDCEHCHKMCGRH